jgi:FkbM family methyltransferase
LPGGVEPEITSLFRAIVEEFGVRSFWDVGANLGYYSWLVKSLAPECVVRLFEPEPDNVVLMRQTIERGRLGNVVVRPVAVGDREAQMSFIRDPVSGFTGELAADSQSFAERHWGLRRTTLTVQTVTLDTERGQAGPVDLIKIDVEGHEEAVFRGGRHTIATDQPIIIFECFHEEREICSMLAAEGYVIADAETIQAPSRATSNFIAIPPRLGCVNNGRFSLRTRSGFQS